jgi:hypothetical protein
MDPPIISVPSDPPSIQTPETPEPPAKEPYTPLKCPYFTPVVDLPCDSSDPLAIWELFFPRGQVNTIRENTNRNAKLPDKTTYKYARNWKPVSLAEVYIWLAILIYMGLYPQNDIESYWNRQDTKPVHKLVWSSMSLNRWEQIRRFFHISPPVAASEKPSVFSKVLSTLKMISHTNSYGNSFR